MERNNSYALDHVQLAMPAGQENVAPQFYVDALKLEEIAKPDALAQRGGAWFHGGTVALHLGVDAEFVPARKAHPALRCFQYDALLEHLGTHGIAFTPDPLPFNGSRHGYIADPFGNRIELIAWQGQA